MSTSFSVAPPDEVAQRIRDCQAEIKALRQLLKVSKAADEAEAARRRRAEGGKL